MLENTINEQRDQIDKLLEEQSFLIKKSDETTLNLL
jgi:hypothetical protein